MEWDLFDMPSRARPVGCRVFLPGRGRASPASFTIFEKVGMEGGNEE